MPQTSLRALPNASGTPTLTTAVLMPDTKVTLTPFNELIEADYKTGTGSMLAGIQGRKGPGSWSAEAPVRPSGVAGTAPQMDALLAGLFGATATIVASTSATYNLVDTFSPFAIFLFNLLATTNSQQWAFGCVPSSATINIGGAGYLKITANGKCVYVMFSDNFANEDVTAKAGYTAVPTVPASPTLTGNIVTPFTGTTSFGGSAMVEFRSASVSIMCAKDLRADGFTDPYPDAIVQGRRKVSLTSLKCADSDGAVLTTVKNAAFNKTTMNVTIVQGATAGSITTHTFKNVQFGNAVINESGSAFDVDFGDSPMHATALANTDEYVLAFT